MNVFSKKDTLAVKGVAMLLLLCHHLGMGISNPPLIWNFDTLYVNIATLSKVCVAMFVFFSGYGLNESYSKWDGSNFSFIKRHLSSLMNTYWFIFIIFVPIGFLCGANPFDVYGRSFEGIIYFILDFFGLKALFNTPTMNQTWWYMETAIVLNILFPIIKKLTKKIPVTVLILTLIPLVVYSYFSDGSYDNCREIFWIFPFVCGILISEYKILNKLIALLNNNYYKMLTFSGMFFLVMTYIRSRFGIIVDTLYAFSIIVFVRTLCEKIKLFERVMVFLGKHSANIFMMHSFLYCYYIPIKQILFVIKSAPINYLILLGECLIVSDYIEIIKKRLGKFSNKSKVFKDLNLSYSNNSLNR